MNIVRLVVTGSVGAGKSTFVRTVGEIGVISTEEIATDETAALKKTTTVAFDFGRVAAGSNLALHVYGTPGQYRFNFMWDILIHKAHAYLVLVAAHRPGQFARTQQIIQYMNQRSQVPMFVGITHGDCPGAIGSQEVLTALGYSNPTMQPPVLTVNPHDKPSVLHALSTMTESISGQASPGWG